MATKVSQTLSFRNLMVTPSSNSGSAPVRASTWNMESSKCLVQGLVSETTEILRCVSSGENNWMMEEEEAKWVTENVEDIIPLMEGKKWGKQLNAVRQLCDSQKDLR